MVEGGTGYGGIMLKVIVSIVGVAAVFILLGAIVSFLWNGVVVDMFAAPRMNVLQGAGIYVLVTLFGNAARLFTSSGE
jgi:hypothetical protein